MGTWELSCRVRTSSHLRSTGVLEFVSNLPLTHEYFAIDSGFMLIRYASCSKYGVVAHRSHTSRLFPITGDFTLSAQYLTTPPSSRWARVMNSVPASKKGQVMTRAHLTWKCGVVNIAPIAWSFLVMGTDGKCVMRWARRHICCRSIPNKQWNHYQCKIIHESRANCSPNSGHQAASRWLEVRTRNSILRCPLRCIPLIVFRRSRLCSFQVGSTRRSVYRLLKRPIPCL